MFRSSIRRLAANRHSLLSLSNKPPIVAKQTQRLFSNTHTNAHKNVLNKNKCVNIGSKKRFSTFNKRKLYNGCSSKQNSSSSTTIFTICLTSCVGVASMLNASSKVTDSKVDAPEDEDEDDDDDDEPVDKSGLEDKSQEKGINPMRRAKVFCGGSNHKLAEEITEHLGMKLGDITVGRFADGEVNVMVNENVRGQDVYLIQPTCPPNVNESLVELLLMVSTMRRASARRITAVIPYYGYARQDRKMTSRVPISAADVARLLESMGVDRVIAIDLHCGQIQGFFGPRVPVDNLEAAQVGVEYFGELDPPLQNPVVVSPDAGGVYRAKKFGEALHKRIGTEPGVAMIIKQRKKAGEIARMDLVGSVEGCDAIIVDDMIDSAGTLCKAAENIKKYGARKVYAFASHGLFSGPADERIRNSCMEKVLVVNTVPLPKHMESNEKLVQLSVGQLLANAILRVHARKSVSELFDTNKKK
jgi:ribose-phosphate pyrophosphokinase